MGNRGSMAKEVTVDAIYSIAEQMNLANSIFQLVFYISMSLKQLKKVHQFRIYLDRQNFKIPI